MSLLGATANALKKVGGSVAGRTVGKTVLKKVPGIGTAVSLLWPTAAASGEDGYWGSDNQWHNGKKPSSGGSTGMMYGPERPSDLDAPGESSGGSSGSGSSSNGSVISAIGKGWDDADDELSSANKSIKSSKTYISNLGKVKNKYLENLDKYKGKVDSAISGNKTLVEQNQKKELDYLAGDVRKTIDNTNVMLGVKGASGGSASRMASRAITNSAGRERSKILTSRGDDMSRLNQDAQDALEDYTTRKKQAEDWEKTEKLRALDEFNEYEEAIERLKDKKSGWRDEDIKAESDKNLAKFMGTITDIKSRGKVFRDNLAAKATEYGLSADELGLESININTPAELNTEKFNENIDFENGEKAEDWFDPNVSGKRVVKGYDAMGNPIYEDAVVA